mgnify:CR=1 FL=1
MRPLIIGLGTLLGTVSGCAIALHKGHANHGGAAAAPFLLSFRIDLPCERLVKIGDDPNVIFRCFL